MAIHTNAQSLDQNFTMSITPKVAMDINEVNELVDISSPTSGNITITTPESNKDFIASQSIKLNPGAKLTPNVVLKINDVNNINSNVFRSITYYDGLGRPIQAIDIGQSPNNKDLVQHYEYDQFGRTEKTYLPIPANQNTGNLMSNAVLETNAYYRNKYGDTNPFAQQRFDDSPLSRVLESANPGNDWELSYEYDTDHTVKYGYDTNRENEVKRYDLNPDGSFNVSYYPANVLMKSITKNENWQPEDGALNTSEVFTDKNGRTIAQIYYSGEGANIEKLVTQHVYDDEGKLIYILTPKATPRTYGEMNQPNRFNWSYTKFLPDTFPGGGGGSSTVYIENGVLKLSASAGFNASPLKTGKIAFIHENLPDMDLGHIVPNAGYSNNYTAYLKDGYLCVRYNAYPASVTLLGFSFEVPVGNLTIPTDQEIIDNLAFQFEYDEFNRQVAKKTPGKEWEYVVYDQLDNPILIQDANLKSDNLWLFTKHDAFGRVIYSGKYASSKSREALQLEVDNFINGSSNLPNVEERISGTSSIAGVNISYSNNAFPKTGITEILAVNYYDDYSFIDPDKPATPSTIEGQVVNNKTRGLPTGSWTKTLEENSWSKSYTYYDQKGRSIKIYEKNHLGGSTTTNSKLDFRGKIEKASTIHKRTVNATTLSIVDRFEYDDSERIEASYQKINNQPEERISKFEYDEIGNIQNKSLGGLATASNGLQKLTYKYNIRGWLKELNDVDNIGNNLFAFKLNYNDPIEGTNTEAHNLFNGNITQSIWRSKLDNTKKSYAYTYDKLNRLTNANYLRGNTLIRDTNNAFEVHNIKYDLNGNITYLDRNGQSGNMDQLSYSYGPLGTNQVTSITDNANKTVGFIDGNTNVDDYSYDDNGNMIKDLNKNITEIIYNHLDLIKKVTFNDGKSISFIYDASGRKLSKIFNSGSNSYRTDYLGGFQYQQNQLQFFPMDEGYVYKDASGTYKHMYIISDHLGNNRVTYSDTNNDGTISSAELLSNTDYYPMGLIQEGEFNSAVTTAFKYKYQAKELQEDNNIDLYDFGSRMYDPTVGRWFNTDPQNQFGSPYLAMGNNHISMIDPNGEYASETIIIAGIVAATIIGGTYAAIATASNGGDFYQSLGAGIQGATVSGVSATVGAATGGAVTSTGIAYAGTLAAGASALASTTSTNLMTGKGFFEGSEGDVIGSMAGAYIGGGIGAFTGGAISGGIRKGSDGGNFGEIASSAGLSGAISLASYEVVEELNYQEYKNGPREFGNLTRSGYRKFSRAGQRSFARNRESGGYFLEDGNVSDIKWGGKRDVNLGPRPDNTRSRFHFHVANHASPHPSLISNEPNDITNFQDGFVISFNNEAYFVSAVDKVRIANKYRISGNEFDTGLYGLSFNRKIQLQYGLNIAAEIESFYHNVNRNSITLKLWEEKYY
ncbi:hypothetical protein GCM10022259_21220 [Aquimarina mytili]